MVVLFVVEMVNGFKSAESVAQEMRINLGGWIAGPESIIAPGVSYVVCPVQAGYEFTKLLFDKFDKVVFLKDHSNNVVRIQQEELEHIYNNSVNYENKKIESKMLFFGCSHTYGVGHSNHETTYPYVFSNYVNREYVNLGMPGKSNYDIEDLMNQYRLNSNYIILQFTDIYRIRYFSKNKLISNPIYKLPIKVVNNDLANEENLLFNFKKLTDRVINRLIEGNNKFLITFSCNFNDEYDLECLKHLLQFKEFCSHVGTLVDKAEDNAHYGIESHRLWAEKLYKKWVELYGTT